MLEKGPSTNLHGAAYYLRSFMQKCAVYKCDLLNKDQRVDNDLDIDIIPVKGIENEIMDNREIE